MDAVDAKWIAFAREAASAAEHLAFGTTILDRASHLRSAYYVQAFFALSTGFERSAKLAVLLGYALDHDSNFPSARQVTDYGHNLEQLFSAVQSLASSRNLSIERPTSRIHVAVEKALSDFARNFTRYYNLGILTGDPKVAQRDDPVADWHRAVTQAIVDLHISERQRSEIEAKARAAAARISHIAVVREYAEGGEEISDVFTRELHIGLNEASKPWERMYVLQLARFLSCVVIELGDQARVASVDVPYLGDFFGIFKSDDALFRSQRRWSIYHD